MYERLCIIYTNYHIHINQFVVWQGCRWQWACGFHKWRSKQILHQFAKEIGSFELDFYNFDELNYEEQLESDKSANLPDADSASNKC